MICHVVGVGKSSITNELLPSPDLAVGYLTKRGQGSHMTSTATFHRIKYNNSTDGALNDGHVKGNESCQDGWIVDSPGLRDFGLAHISEEDIHKGFSEIFRASQGCKYRNCRHEPDQDGCAVLAAVNEGHIEMSRYKNFSSLLAQHRQAAHFRTSFTSPAGSSGSKSQRKVQKNSLNTKNGANK